MKIHVKMTWHDMHLVHFFLPNVIQMDYVVLRIYFTLNTHTLAMVYTPWLFYCSCVVKNEWKWCAAWNTFMYEIFMKVMHSLSDELQGVSSTKWECLECFGCIWDHVCGCIQVVEGAHDLFLKMVCWCDEMGVVCTDECGNVNKSGLGVKCG